MGEFMYQELQYGMTGDDVKILEEKLKRLGYYNAVITGSFGRSVEEGVMAFQKQVGLDPTGIVTRQTWDALNEYTEPQIAPISLLPTLSLGSTGNYVSDLKTKLKALLYYTGPINDTFDLETQNAVKRFQYNNDITASGVVNDTTWNVLNSLYGNLNPCALPEDVPSTPPSDNNLTYTVQRGDTLYQIARRFNTTVDAIKSLNNLTSDTLQIGQILKIPTIENEGYISYTVQSGDTLYAIARRYNTTVDEIKRLNNLTSNTLGIGQVLTLPTKSLENTFDYVVQSGDTLYAIARRYNTTVDSIKQVNNLTSNTLTIGQVLKIPTSNPVDYITYMVQSGDRIFMGNNE